MFAKVREHNHIKVDTSDFDTSPGSDFLDSVLRETQQHSHYGHIIYGFVMSGSSTSDVNVDLNGGASWGQSDRVRQAMLWIGSAYRQTQPSVQPAKGILCCVKLGSNFAASKGKLASFQADAYGYRFFSQVRTTAVLSTDIYSTGLTTIRCRNATFNQSTSRFIIRFQNRSTSSQSLFYRVTGWVWS